MDKIIEQKKQYAANIYLTTTRDIPRDKLDYNILWISRSNGKFQRNLTANKNIFI